MGYQGTVLTFRELLARALAAPEPPPHVNVGLRHDAASNARHCAALHSADEDLGECWRFAILQTLDDYTSTLRRGGVKLAAQVFTTEPTRTGAPEIDAALAALADYLADRDGWQAPSWALDPTRRVDRWYAAVPQIFHQDADRESPEAFRSRGIYITKDSLKRA